MKRFLKPLVSLAIVGSTLSLASAGWAFWKTTGTGTGTGTVGSLAAPTGVIVPTTSTGTVTVTWTPSPVVAPDVAPTGYLVQRFAGTTASPACGTSPTAPTPATTCNDAGVTGGTYTYRVTAVFRSWTAQSPASAPVTVSGGGLRFSSCSSNNRTVVCPPSDTPNISLNKSNQNGSTWTARVTLTDGNGNAVVNNGTSTISVTVGKLNANSTITYSSGSALTIPPGMSESTNTFTYSNVNVPNGAGGDTVTASSAGRADATAAVTW